MAQIPMKDQFFAYIQGLQDRICAGLEAADGQARFQEDLWDRPEGGGGRTRVLEGGKVLEKAGVNISGVHGDLPPAMQQYFGVGESQFYACGLSLVLHPRNPMAPTVHANSSSAPAPPCTDSGSATPRQCLGGCSAEPFRATAFHTSPSTCSTSSSGPR